MRNSTIEVIKTTGKILKLDLSQLTEEGKEKFYYEAQKY